MKLKELIVVTAVAMVAAAPALAGETAVRAADTQPIASAKAGVKSSLSKRARASVKTTGASTLGESGTIALVVIAAGGAIAGIVAGTTGGSPR